MEEILKNIGFKFDEQSKNEVIFSGIPSNFNENKNDNLKEIIFKKEKELKQKFNISVDYLELRNKINLKIDNT